MSNLRFLAQLALTGLGGLLLLLTLLASSAPPTLAAGAILRVPDDYATVQAAVDAAQPGDTIRVVAETFAENLSVSKAITLSGGWDPAFAEQTADNTVLDGQGLGRVISITLAGPDTVVVEHFTLVRGDGTGLGGLDAGLQAGPTHNAGSITATLPLDRAPIALRTAPADLRPELAEWWATGRVPDGVGPLPEVIQRLDRWDALAAAYASTPTVADDDAPDCGGAVYSSGAGLWLHDNIIADNVASRSGDGYGGGVCILDAPAGTVHLHDNVIEQNIASLAGAGLGGGVYVANTPGATLTANSFTGNVAAAGGSMGLGGGLYASAAAALAVDGNRFDGNAASTGPQVSAPAVGGALYAVASNGIQLTGNQFTNNLAGLYAGGVGGAVYLFQLQGAQVTSNEITGNWAVVYGYIVARAGGIGIGDATQITLAGNTITGNVGAFYPSKDQVFVTAAGGGIFAASTSDVMFTGNTIGDNVGAMAVPALSDARGGGMGVDTSRSGPATGWTIAGNTIDGNVMLATGSNTATGGGARLTIIGSAIRGNRFTGNIACGECAEPDTVNGLLIEGALESTVVSAGPADVDANFIVADRSAHPDMPGYGMVVRSTNGFTLTNNVIANFDAGFAVSGGYMLPDNVMGRVINNTFANRIQGIYVNYWNGQPIELVNNVVVSHSVGITVGLQGKVTLGYTLLDGNAVDIGGSGVYTVADSVSGPVAFVDPAAGNFDLRPDSAAIDAGDPAGVPPAPPLDIIGTPRPQLARVDIGAYEARISRDYLPLINGPQPCAGRSDIGWVVGDSKDGYGTILHTTDGGATWQRQGAAGAIPDMHLNEASAVDADNAWVVGSQAILRTRDGGQTWENQPLPAGLPGNINLIGIKALNTTTAYAVGTESTLLQTTDGSTWTRMPVDPALPTDVQFQTVDAVDSSHVWAVGAVGARVRPIIAFYDGTRWREQSAGAFPDPDTDAFIGVSAVDRNHVWVVGGFNMPLVYTADGGATWQRSPAGLSTGDMNRVVAVDASTGWVSGDFGSVKYTTDSGATWHNTTLPGGYLFGVSAMNGQVAWVVGPADQASTLGLIARTCNATDWQVMADPGWPGLNGVSFVGARR